MFASAAPERVVQLTLYTDSYQTRGSLRTRQHRVSDILNMSEEPFLLVQDALIEEYGIHGATIRAAFAQVNLAAVLFAVVSEPETGSPELRTPKSPQQAIVTVPPFKLVGDIHLTPNRDLGEALELLTQRFIPLTDVVFWSDAIGEARTAAPMVAFNHARAQILAPHEVVDPWAGLDSTGGVGAAPDAETRAGGEEDPQTGWR